MADKTQKDKPASPKMPNTGADDGLPSHAELDALQAEIDKAADAIAARNETVTESGPDIDAGAGEGEVDGETQGTDRVAELEAEMATLKDQALRAMAEAENVKKRAEREIITSKAYAIERFAIDILSVCDNLGRALLTLEGQARDDLGDNAKNLVDGIELTEKDLMAVLARHGIKAVPGQGSKFNPNVHQAVAQIPSDEDKGHVAQVMQTGFPLGDRTLRAAMVAVSAGPAKNS